MSRKNKIIILFIILNIFFNLNIVYAQILDGSSLVKIAKQQEAFRTSSGFEYVTLGEIIAPVIKAFLSFLGIIFLILILYGGYLWMTARGNEEQVKKAKDLIKTAIIGLIIIVAAYSITYFVFRNMPGGGGAPLGGG